LLNAGERYENPQVELKYAWTCSHAL